MRLPDPERSRVLLIGTSEYNDSKLPSLPVIDRSIRDLEIQFTDPVFGLVPPQHCERLLNEGDLRRLGRSLKAAVEGAEDLLLVYFAGHGLVGGKRHELYLGLPDSEWSHPEFNSLEYDKLKNAILNSRASAKVIVLDCCFSGRVIAEVMADPVTSVMGQIEVDGTYVLTSAHRNEAALVLPGEKHTAFTGRLLNLFRNGVPSGPDLLTVDEIYRQLLRQMKAEGLSEPQKVGTRTADLIALARNRAVFDLSVSVLESRYMAALARSQQGDWDDTARLLGDLEGDLIKVLGVSHPLTLRAQQLAAHAMGALGKAVEAARHLNEILKRQQAVSGEEHEDVLQSRQLLAVNIGEAGYRSDAIDRFRILLSDRRRLLGQNADPIMRTCHMLARNLFLVGKTEEARALLKEVIVERKRMLGDDHPLTKRAIVDLASLGRE